MTTPPRDLRTIVAHDLQPARPLRSPGRRVLALAPIAAATVLGVPMLFFFRSDFAQLSFARGWGLSALEAIGGVLVVSAALREAIPGRGYSRTALAWLFITGLALPFVILAVTARGDYTIGAGPGAGWFDGVYCFRTSALAAVPALAVAAILVARAFAVRPGVAGALYGLGSGVIADAGLRLFCEFSVPSHFVAAHEGAVVAAMCVGSVVGKVGELVNSQRSNAKFAKDAKKT
jgi:hypothetical protein